MRKRRKIKLKKSDLVLICSIVAVIVYTVAAIILQWHTSVEISPTLTEKWYQFWTIEIVALSGIKIVNVFRGEDNGDRGTM